MVSWGDREGRTGWGGLWKKTGADSDAPAPSTFREDGGREEESATGMHEVEVAANLLHEHS